MPQGDRDEENRNDHHVWRYRVGIGRLHRPAVVRSARGSRCGESQHPRSGGTDGSAHVAPWQRRRVRSGRAWGQFPGATHRHQPVAGCVHVHAERRLDRAMDHCHRQVPGRHQRPQHETSRSQHVHDRHQRLARGRPRRSGDYQSGSMRSDAGIQRRQLGIDADIRKGKHGRPLHFRKEVRGQP